MECNIYYSETTICPSLLMCYWLKYALEGKFTVYKRQFLSEHRKGDVRNKGKHILMNIYINIYPCVKEH